MTNDHHVRGGWLREILLQAPQGTAAVEGPWLDFLHKMGIALGSLLWARAKYLAESRWPADLD